MSLEMRDFLSKNKFSLGFFPLVACNGVSVGTSGIAVTLYAVHMGATASQIGLIRGFESLGILLGVFLMGLLVDHIGPRKVFMCGGLAAGVGYLWLVQASSPGVLMVWVGIIGFCVSSRMVSMNSIFMGQLKSIGNHKSGWYRASHSIGFSFIGPLLGGAVIHGEGYPITFRVVSLLFLISVGLASIVLEAEKRIGTPKESLSAGSLKTGAPIPALGMGTPKESLSAGSLKTGARSGFSPAETWVQTKRLFRNRLFIQTASTEGVITATMSCFNTFAVVLALRVYGLSQEDAAFLVALHGIVFIFSLFFLGRFLARWGSNFFYFSSLSIGLTALFLLGGTPGFGLAVAGLLLLAVSLGMLTVVNYSALSDIPGERGKMAGVYGVFSVSGMALGPALGGVLGEAFGLRAIFLGLTPLFLLLGISRFWTRHGTEDRSDPSGDLSLGAGGKSTSFRHEPTQ
jgi:MFS family permease